VTRVRRLRQLAWRAGTPVRMLLVGGIRVYRVTLSGWLGGQCRYLPSCSRYAEAAIRTHGAVRGSALALWRIVRCNPFGHGGIEPVPPRRRAAETYDEIIHGAGAAGA
jgi:putative membrane protein insertion efficiency factor